MKVKTGLTQRRNDATGTTIKDMTRPLSAKYDHQLRCMRVRLNKIHSPMGYALLCEMVIMAELTPEFGKKLELWLSGDNGKTFLIRELGEEERFKKMFIRRQGEILKFDELAHWNAVHDLDTAILVHETSL